MRQSASVGVALLTFFIAAVAHAQPNRGRSQYDDREDVVGLQPEELRERHANDEQPVVAVRRGLLDRRGGSVDLPSEAIGMPMTYMVDAKQHIALGIVGGPRMVAFALPD